ncbi:DegT/DnrJ/EryC1/StrS family aminotransferase [Thermoflavifilum thermophilum]|uniref:dTDP-4-amino-4,6-dideoxygalactose transaminase n=1 Tax=Thermoflavifilum thermophilum TaxID=1393122 RepID=A0A1I7NFM7_9BACT|nr:DegT/DnrJ/EryC1/StrS family aminotransferase [Thermoflavifilum thermophilum]SFV33459.1 dTDP-4-amino-4,6-dideoxygalactose transaminase [Thermoflavifilum thermophilum]
MHSPIQMVDLKRQYQKIKSEIDKAISEVLESCAFIQGPQVHAFAAHLQAYLDVKHVIPCANGTDALQIAMMALDLQPGDEVITPSFTYIATAEVIALLKLKPVFVDVDPHTFCMDVEAVRQAITPRTKAIVPVHLFGQSVDMQPLLELAKAHHLAVIEDNAQAIGCCYRFKDGSSRKTGTMGHIGCTSFFPSKNLGAYGDAGAICTHDDALAEKIRMIANHGQSQRYYHDLVGCNSRLDSIQAAILDVKLRYLDQYIAARQQAANRYDAGFANIPQITIPHRADYCTHVFHQYTILVPPDQRSALQQYLAQQGIPTMIYYPVPCHQQKMFSSLPYIAHSLKTTEWLSERVLSLPMHTELDDEQQDFIIEKIRRFFS